MATFRRRPPREDLFHLVVSARFIPTRFSLSPAADDAAIAQS
jgi:hypothetical protein